MLEKGQVLADFLVKIQSFEPLKIETMVFLEEKMNWVMNTDGASNKSEVGIGIVLENSSGVLIKEAVRLEEIMTNNEAEYKALLYRLELALRLGVQHLKINLDPELVSGQLVGAFEAKDSRIKSYCDIAKSLRTKFKHVKIEVVKRELNS